MSCFKRGILIACCSAVFANRVHAQSNNDSAVVNATCGDDITYASTFFNIQWSSYCDLKLTNNYTAAPVQRSSFGDCSAACANQGTSCVGFAFDRTSHFGDNNCYLNAELGNGWSSSSQLDNTYFDSALVVPSSLPTTTRDCAQTGTNGIYNNMTLHCGQNIHDSSQSGNRINSNFAASLGDCVNLCRNCNSTNGCALPCQAVTWDNTLRYGYNNCVMRARGYIAPVDDEAWDSATLIGTEGLVVPEASSSSTSSRSTPTATSNPATDYGSGKHGLPSSVYAGIAVGAVCAVVIVGGLIVLMYRRHTERSRRAHAEREPPMREILGAKLELSSPPGPSKPPVPAMTKIDVKGKGRAIETVETGSGSGSSSAELGGRPVLEIGESSSRRAGAGIGSGMRWG